MAWVRAKAVAQCPGCRTTLRVGLTMVWDTKHSTLSSKPLNHLTVGRWKRQKCPKYRHWVLHGPDHEGHEKVSLYSTKEPRLIVV